LELPDKNSKKRNMKKKYWIIAGVVVLVAAATAWMVFGKKKGTTYEWRTVKLEKGDIQVTVRASGTLQAVTTVQVGTQVSGIIENIYVDFNSVVREGQMIALLDTTYLAQAVDDARASLKRAEIQVNQSKRDYDRTKLLFDQKVMAQADYDLALSTYETAVANAVSAQSAVNRAKINLKYATIVAPISGVVVSRAVDVGQTVAASFSTPTMFTIANDLTKMQVEANIDEGDIGQIKVGQEVTFTVDAYPELTFSGTVRQVRLQPVVTQNVVNYTVIIDVPNEELKLLPGMTANITVMVSQAKDVLKVPATALRFSPPQAYIEEMMKNLSDSLKPRQRKPPSDSSRATYRSQGSGTDGSLPGQRMKRGGGEPPAGINPMDKIKTGTVWVKSNGIVRPERVRVGLSDGTYTEVRGRNLKEGDEIVMALTNSQNGQNSQQKQQQSPFVPTRPPSGSRGGR